jgi:hypothetical protein
VEDQVQQHLPKEQVDCREDGAAPPPNSSSLLHHSYSSLTVKVDTEQLLAKMMNEAEKIVGRVVDITNEAWKHKHAKEEQQLPQQRQEGQALTADEKQQYKDLGVSPSSSSVSPRLGAKTVSEASFVPLGMSIVDPQQQQHRHVAAAAALAEALEVDRLHGDDEAAIEQQQPVASSFSAAGAPPETPIRSNSKRSLGDDNDDDRENYSPVDSAAAERASHIIDFVFDEIDFVIATATTTTNATNSSCGGCGTPDLTAEKSTFKLSPIRKKMKTSDDDGSSAMPSLLFLPSIHAHASPDDPLQRHAHTMSSSAF